MNKPLVIFGNGDIAKLARWYFEKDAARTVAAFAVDREFRSDDEVFGLPLVDFEEVERQYPPAGYDMFIALSYRNMNRDREAKYHAAKEKGYVLPSYVSPRCTYLAEEPPGDNCFILENNIIQPFVEIGCNVTLWGGVHLCHDSVVGDHVFIASQAVVSGCVSIGNNCFVGINATLRNGISIAPFTTIGAGALVMKSTQENQTLVGGRARLLKDGILL